MPDPLLIIHCPFCGHQAPLRLGIPLPLCEHARLDATGLHFVAPTNTKSPWDEDTKYPAKDWQHEVGNDDTRLGYLEWVEHHREAEG